MEAGSPRPASDADVCLLAARSGHLPDLEDLAHLVLVANLGSIGQAAVQLGVAQPGLSRRLAALERSLRLPLLNRGPRGTTLTETGKVVVAWAGSLLEAADRFERSVSSLRGQQAETVQVAVSMTIAEHCAPRWIAGLQRAAPGVAMSLIVHNSAEVCRLVESGQVDLGFVESPTVRPTLQRRTIGSDRLVVAVAPGHDWAELTCPLEPRELASTRLLVREPGSGTRETLEAALGAAGLELLPGPVVGSNTALKAVAHDGRAPIVLSELALEQELTDQTLVEVPVRGLSLSRPLSAVWRRNEALPEGAMEMLKVVARNR